LSELDSFSTADQEALQKFMDSFLVSILHKKGLIIDLRASHGGHDEFAYMIASRFTDKKFQANFSRIFKTNIFDSIEVKHFVEPKGNFQFTKPIIVLTNDGARSAADVFALTMKQLPHVTIIGENTFGSFGESIYKDIGNGWYINYPIEKFYSPQGQCYEGTGVPVDFKIENSTHDIISRIDNVIVSAISLINK
jgi:C-terminal processing protease CtpA/Prc